MMCPAVEQLHNLCTTIYLVTNVYGQGIGQVRKIAVQYFWILGHDLLCSDKMSV